MGSLKNKSELNIEAAELLFEKNFFPSVIHCAYYSCVQLMLHMWLNTMGKTDQDLKDLQKSSNKGSHEVLINQIKLFVESKSFDDRVFNTAICTLKRLRVESDYKNKIIDQHKCEKSITLCKSILNTLENCL